jgi:DNA-binding transcriptional LysR family regulator
MEAEQKVGAVQLSARLRGVLPPDLSRPGGFGLLSSKVWRLSHLGAKHEFLRAGLGFSLMPLHMIEADLASGALVQISGESAPPEGYVIAMLAVYRTDNPPGPAGRWFIDRLKQEDARWLDEKAPRSDYLDGGLRPRTTRHSDERRARAQPT